MCIRDSCCEMLHTPNDSIAREVYYTDLSSPQGEPNFHWQHKLGPVYNQGEDLDKDRFAYPHQHAPRLHDPPTTSDPPHRVKFQSQSNAQGFHARSDMAHSSRSRTYQTQIDLSGHAHKEVGFSVPPTRVDPVAISHSQGRGYECRVRGQADDYGSSQSFMIPTQQAQPGLKEHKVKIPARSAMQFDFKGAPVEDLRVQPTSQHPNPNYNPAHMDGSLRSSHWQLEHQPQEAPEPVPLIGQTHLDPVVLQMTADAAAAGTELSLIHI
eukprot:TRINITY_DN22372_c0_g1_i3.p1 TRINITY_DN22372_c0_g1~~TRINITY_DN22372_c0_g1_i3.p1  ORF type:complete len:267 (-),score=62.56 TRINITY_DN22372_c0_g1_i3:85-885(-)